MTHGDQFRAMDDKRLATFLGTTGLCPPSCAEERQKCESCSTEYTGKMWLEYLQSEAEE